MEQPVLRLIMAIWKRCLTKRQAALYGSHNESGSFLVVSDEKHTLHEGILADIAPTLLELLKIKQPAAMTGKSLLTDKINDEVKLEWQ